MSSINQTTPFKLINVLFYVSVKQSPSIHIKYNNTTKALSSPFAKSQFTTTISTLITSVASTTRQRTNKEANCSISAFVATYMVRYLKRYPMEPRIHLPPTLPCHIDGLGMPGHSFTCFCQFSLCKYIHVLVPTLSRK